MKKRIGIRIRVASLTIIAMFLLTAVIAGIGYRRFRLNVLQTYYKYAETVIGLANSVFEETNMGDLVDARSMGPQYEEARAGLNNIKNNCDVKYLYAVYFDDINDMNSLCYIINGKSDLELELADGEDVYSYMGEECEPGAYDDKTFNLLRDCILNKDRIIRFMESDTAEYGWLVTGYTAVFDSQGNAVAVVAADVDANKIRDDMNTYLKTVVLAAFIVTIIMIVLFMMLVSRYITDPVQRIAKSAGDYVGLMDLNVSPEELIYESVDVRSNDEIRDLSGDVESLANGVRSYMANLESVTAEKERIGAELNVATQIQADMLPRIFPPFPDRKEFDIYATMDPAKEVGGDFYDFFLIDDDHICLVMADVSGKGVPAALFMVIAKTLIKNRALLGGSPSEILSYANDQLCEGNEAELFVTVWIAIIEISTGKGLAANAGHEHPVLKKAGGQYELVEYRHSPAVATMEGIPFRQHEFELSPGDEIFVYTDGVPEATNKDNELYGTDRMLTALNNNKDASCNELLKEVRASIDGFVGDAPQFDDITMLSFVYHGPDTDKDSE